MSTSVTIKDRAMDMKIQQVPWWNRRTRMERRFFILSIFLLFATIGLSVALAGVLYKDIFAPSDNNVRDDYVISDNKDANSFATSVPFSNRPVDLVTVPRNPVELGAGKQVLKVEMRQGGIYIIEI